MKIHLLSPLPPKQTGTADYIGQLLDELLESCGEGIQSSLMLWDHRISASDAHELRKDGWRVGDVSDAVFKKDDVVVFFLASNDYHDWVWERLSLGGDYTACSVVHDLTAFPQLRKLARSENNTLTSDDEILALSYEFGNQARWISDNFDRLTNVAKYFVMGQGLTLARSDHVIVHSGYAKTRLEVESAWRSEDQDGGLSNPSRLPPIWVCNHPHVRVNPDVALLNSTIDAHSFCIGSVGFYSRIKRNDALLEAFGAFVGSLSPEDRRRTRLVFVGKISDPLLLEAEAIIKKHRIADLVSFTGYVDEALLQAWQARIDLQINLRFPSCGETSGTLARAQSMKKRVVCSSFAAFREEPCTWSISTDPAEEFSSLITILSAEFERWKLGPQEAAAEHGPSSKMRFADVLSRILQGSVVRTALTGL